MVISAFHFLCIFFSSLNSIFFIPPCQAFSFAKEKDVHYLPQLKILSVICLRAVTDTRNAGSGINWMVDSCLAAQKSHFNLEMFAQYMETVSVQEPSFCSFWVRLVFFSGFCFCTWFQPCPTPTALTLWSVTGVRDHSSTPSASAHPCDLGYSPRRLKARLSHLENETNGTELS